MGIRRWLSIAGGFLPSHPALAFDFGDVAVASRWDECRLGVLNRGLGRRDNDLHDLAKACLQKITGQSSVIGVISDKRGNWAINLIQKISQSGWIANLIRG